MSVFSEPWLDFLSEIFKERKEIGCGQGNDVECWFRGHTRSDYKLMPSLFRAFDRPNSKKNWTKVFYKESDLFWEFAARARGLKDMADDDWGILFAMQHYGTPTRLLDWTESFGVAIYFATLGVDESLPVGNDGCQRDENGEAVPPPCIWVLNPYGMNDVPRWVSGKNAEADLIHPPNLGWDPYEKEYYGYGDLLSEGYMDWKWPAAIYPRQRNPRIHAQRGWFTIHGDEFVPIDDIPGHRRYTRPVELPFSAVGQAKEFLKLAGIDHYLLFSDLESLSLHLQEKNGIISRKQAEAKARARIERRDIVPT